MTPSHALFFFFNDTATTEIYTLSLHDALPISTPMSNCRRVSHGPMVFPEIPNPVNRWKSSEVRPSRTRSEEHTSELQSPCNLVCRLLLEKKKHLQRTKYCPSLN